LHIEGIKNAMEKKGKSKQLKKKNTLGIIIKVSFS